MPSRRAAAYLHPAQLSFAPLLWPGEYDCDLCDLDSDDAAAAGYPDVHPSEWISEAGAGAAAAVTSAQVAAALASDFAPIYSVQLVQTGGTQALWAGQQEGQLRAKIGSPGDAARLLFDYVRGADREHLVVLLLDTKNQVIGINTVSVGNLSCSLAHPREVFKPALLANAASILLAHNHPSGDPAPSPEDKAVTERLGAAGNLLGVEVLDHVVLGDAPNRFASLCELGYYHPDKAAYALPAQTGDTRDDGLCAAAAAAGPMVITCEGAWVMPAGYAPPQPF